MESYLTSLKFPVNHYTKQRPWELMSLFCKKTFSYGLFIGVFYMGFSQVDVNIYESLRRLTLLTRNSYLTQPK